MSTNDKATPAAILLVAVVLACGITGPKLHKMARIKGWIPGANVVQKEISAKWVEPAVRLRDDDRYFVSWGHDQNRASREDRARVPESVWGTMQVGDRVDVVLVPGDSSPYLRDGIFVEPGQFVFDVVLLAAEVVTALVMLALLISRFRRGRSPALTPEFVRKTITAAIEKIDESLAQFRQELEQLEAQARSEQSPGPENHYLRLADEKRKAMEEIVKSRRQLEDQLNRIRLL